MNVAIWIYKKSRCTFGCTGFHHFKWLHRTKLSLIPAVTYIHYGIPSSGIVY